ncbi:MULTISPECIES: hypothetical protein [unclassified Vibrio]|uniref:PFGI-1 class ICE element type IV pilus protein PilL2 n=1 Tax=unclassified Vibrio TaxID=2614977 RepID=UPI00354B25E7
MQTRWLMLSFAGLLAGCQTPPEPVQAPPPPLNIRTAPELSGSSVQTSRYVIERSAGDQMTDILGVPIEARLPVMSKMSIKDGVEFLLSGSGMSLRTPTSYAETQLYAQPLPLGHTDMGHMSLRQALQVIGGQAFSLEEDVVRRNVGFRLKYGYEWQAPKSVSGYSDGKSPLAGSVKASKVATTSSISSSPKDAPPSVVMTPQLKKSLASKSASSEAMSSFEGDNDAFFASDMRVKPSTSQTTPYKSSVKKKAQVQLLTADGKTAPKALPAPTTFFIGVNESPYRALSRWFHDKRIDKVAFELSAEEREVLMRPLEKYMNFTGSLPRTITQVGEALDLSLRLDVQQGVAGLHTLKGPVDVRWVKGETLKSAVASLAESYQWHWLDGGVRASWMSEDDYPLTGEYGVVTPRGAFDKALDTVLEGYPVQAQLISSSRTVFITERQ